MITSNTRVLPEVAGNAAVLVNPEDTEELADAITRVAQVLSLWKALRTRVFEGSTGIHLGADSSAHLRGLSRTL